MKKINIKKIEIKKTKKVLNKSFVFVAKHAFPVCLILFLLCLMIGTFLFYKYYILIQKTDLASSSEEGLLNKGAYQDVLGVWLEYEETTEQAGSKEHKNPFLEAVPEELTD